MLIVADENIPFVHRFFSRLGEVRLAQGRQIDRAAVRDADMLLVRSVTKVNAELLEGSRVRFVGTATIGTNHVDLEWLRQQGIGFASARDRTPNPSRNTWPRRWLGPLEGWGSPSANPPSASSAWDIAAAGWNGCRGLWGWKCCLMILPSPVKQAIRNIAH